MPSTRVDTVARLLATRRTIVASGAGLAAAAMTGRVTAADATPAACPTLSADEMENRVLAVVDAWNAQDRDALAQLFHEDHQHRWNGGAEPLDRDGYLDAMETMWNAFEDLTYTADDVITADDVAVLRFTLSGRQVQAFDGIPPGDHSATWTAIIIFTFRCGFIVEAWAEANHLGRLRQQGSFPTADCATPVA